MLPSADPYEAAIAEAVALARDFAPELDAVLFTVFPDAETLDTLRPGESDLALTDAMTRAVAAELAEAGVRIFVQRADRSAFRRWMAGRADTPEARRAWRNRTGFLGGAAALEALGVDLALAPPPTPRLGRAPGPLADELLDGYADEDPDRVAFEELAEDCIEAGRADVLDLAVRKARDAMDEAGAEELRADLCDLAGAAEVGPSGWAELVALPVALPPADVPDAEDLAAGFLAAGALAPNHDVRFLSGWRAPEALAALAPTAVRRLLTEMAAGGEPAGLPPADRDDLAASGFGVLLGARIDWAVPSWEEIVSKGPPGEAEEDDTAPEEAAREAAFARWRSEVFQAKGCVPLSLVSLSEAGAEIADFVEEARGQVGGLEEIREFVAMARREAAGEDVVCVPARAGADLELANYTTGGRWVDSLTVRESQMPAAIEDILRMLGSCVTLAPKAPG